MLMSNAPKDDIDKMLWLINIQEAIRLIPNITGKARLALLLIPGYTLRNEDVHCSSDSAEELEKLGLIKLVDKQVGITSSGICTVLVMLGRLYKVINEESMRENLITVGILDKNGLL